MFFITKFYSFRDLIYELLTEKRDPDQRKAPACMLTDAFWREMGRRDCCITLYSLPAFFKVSQVSESHS